MTHDRLKLYLLGQERIGVSLRGTAALSAPAGGATLILAKDEVLSFRPFRPPLHVACVAGHLWATMDGSPEDHLLGPGEHRTFGGRGAVVIKALRTATLRVGGGTPIRSTV